MKSKHRLSPTPRLEPDVYQRWRASELGAITERLEQSLVLSLVGNPAGQDALDLGCGDGALAVSLARKGAAVTGLDASPAMIAAAGRRAKATGTDVSLCLGRAERLPFADGSFDLVAAVTILCFVADAEQTFVEMGRVLRPGGKLVIGELGKWSTWAAGRRIRAWLGSPLWRRGFFRTPAELKELARVGGLAPGTVRGAVYYPRCGLAARYLSRLDPWLSAHTTAGAAFLALRAVKEPTSAR